MSFPFAKSQVLSAAPRKFAPVLKVAPKIKPVGDVVKSHSDVDIMDSDSSVLTARLEEQPFKKDKVGYRLSPVKDLPMSS